MTVIRLSGGPRNQSPNLSLGGRMSSTVVQNDINHNLFDTVTKLNILNEQEEYRCVYVFNETTQEVRNLIIEMSGNSEQTDISIGAEDDVAQVINNTSISPIGVIFKRLKDFILLELPGGNLLPNEGKALWIRRLVQGGTNEGVFSLKISWTDLDYTPDETIHEKINLSESIRVQIIRTPSRMGEFTMGEGVMS